jgi:uncharacterized protein (DUF1501 family)
MSTPDSPPISRREFLGQASCRAVGSTALFSTLLTLRLANALSAQTVSSGGDYKALVCLFLAGGNDSFNMLVPTSAGEYAAYAKARSGLALATDTLLGITPSNLGGRTFGLHPSMPELRDLFNQGKLGFVSNVGSLIRPLTLADYKAGKSLPVSLYSHADQVKQWQTCIPDQRTAVGWGGRAADIIASLNDPSLVSMNISLSGQNVFLTGQKAFTYSVGSSGATALTGYDTAAVNNLTAQRTKGVDGVLGQQYRSLFEQTYANTTREAIDSYKEFTNALAGVTLSTVIPSGNSVASNLAMVARTIAARAKLGARRQVFFVMLGGFDLHDNLLTGQPALLKNVSQGVSTFWSALNEIGMQNQVTLFSASDFGRTLTSNGDGSDHAWGGNHFVVGGAVQGGQIFGDKAAGYYPDLQNMAAIDTGSGRLIPGVAVDEYARDLLTWFGISRTDLDYVLPAFSSRFAGRNELGIMGAAAATTTPTPTTPTTPTTTPTTSTGSSGGGGGGGATSPIMLGALGAAALLRLRQKRIAAQAKASTAQAEGSAK